MWADGTTETFKDIDHSAGDCVAINSHQHEPSEWTTQECDQERKSVCQMTIGN